MIDEIIVLTVVKNPGDLIQLSLDSLYTQLNVKFRHIIIDGGSEDNWTFEINWKKYISSEVIQHRDEGIYDGLNNAIKYVPAEAIFTFLHAGDLFLYKNYLSESIGIFKNDDQLDMLYSDIKYHSADLKEVRIFRSGKYDKQKIKYGWVPAHTSLIIKKEFYNKVGEHDTSYRISGDYEWMLRAFSKSPVTYYNVVYSVSMLTGGVSTAGLYSSHIKFLEDLKATNVPIIKGFIMVFGKKLRKINQIKILGTKPKEL